MKQATKFWDNIVERYSKQPSADEASDQKKLPVTRKYFQPIMEVLEFGCGAGATADEVVAHRIHEGNVWGLLPGLYHPTIVREVDRC